MAEPTSSAVAGAVAAAPAALFSTFLGADVNAVIVGLIAAVFFTIVSAKLDDKVKAGASVLLSSLLAGYGAPVAAVAAQAHFPEIGAAGAEPIRMLLAVLIGVAGPTALSALLSRISKEG